VAGHNDRLVAFVYMPEHVHLLVYPTPGFSPISELLKAIKRPYSFRIKKLLEESGGWHVPEHGCEGRGGCPTRGGASTPITSMFWA
jgi:REP element-mobilizing transposase RayT